MVSYSTKFPNSSFYFFLSRWSFCCYSYFVFKFWLKKRRIKEMKPINQALLMMCYVGEGAIIIIIMKLLTEKWTSIVESMWLGIVVDGCVRIPVLESMKQLYLGVILGRMKQTYRGVRENNYWAKAWMTLNRHKWIPGAILVLEPHSRIDHICKPSNPQGLLSHDEHSDAPFLAWFLPQPFSSSSSRGSWDT